MRYGLTTTIDRPYDAVLAEVRVALIDQAALASLAPLAVAATTVA